VLVSVRAEEHASACQPLAELHRLGFRVLATEGTAKTLADAGVPAESVHKVGEGSPHVVDRIEAGDVDLVINTVGADPQAVRDSFSIRRATLQQGIPYFTTMAAARAAAGAIAALRQGTIGVKSLQEIHSP
jgi:carbamoyl-phosphate synthase large subunit